MQRPRRSARRGLVVSAPLRPMGQVWPLAVERHRTMGREAWMFLQPCRHGSCRVVLDTIRPNVVSARVGAPPAEGHEHQPFQVDCHDSQSDDQARSLRRPGAGGDGFRDDPGVRVGHPAGGAGLLQGVLPGMRPRGRCVQRVRRLHLPLSRAWRGDARHVVLESPPHRRALRMSPSAQRAPAPFAHRGFRLFTRSGAAPPPSRRACTA
jgi:hypothetical protein